MKSAVVTGATGVVGKALVDFLIKKGIKVLVLVRNSESADKIVSSPLVNTVVCPLEALDDFNAEGPFDAFFHLGWSGTYGEARNDLNEQLKNVDYALSAVRLAKRLNCKSFVGVGSQAEYGIVSLGTKLSPQTPLNPVTGYGKAKLAAFEKCKTLCGELDIKFCWCRILSVYGAGDKPYTLIMQAIAGFVNGNECPFTPAEQQWDYLNSGDLAYALYLIAEKGKDGKAYTVGCGETRQLKEYIETVYRIVGNENAVCKFGAIDYFPNQVMYLCADISDLTRDTGFVPRISFEDGIKETIEWYKRGLKK